MSEHRFLPWHWRHEGEGVGERHPLKDLQRGMNRLFDQMYEKIGKHHHGVSGHLSTEVSPRTDLGKAEDAFRVSVELPGVEQGDVEVLISDDVLTIQGEKKLEREAEGRSFLVRERTFGRFTRSFQLPPGLQADKADAAFDKGVLTVTIPWKRGARPTTKRIPVKSR